MPRLHESPEGVRWWPVRARGRAGCSHPHRRTMGIRVNVFTPSSRALPDPFLTPPYNRFTNWGCSENSREKRKIPKVPRHVGISYLCLGFSVGVCVGGGLGRASPQVQLPRFLEVLPSHPRPLDSRKPPGSDSSKVVQGRAQGLGRAFPSPHPFFCPCRGSAECGHFSGSSYTEHRC